MSNLVSLQCSCQTVKGTVNIVPGSFFHVACLCCDCQSHAAHLNNKDNILDAHGGTELVQTYPAHMEITQGQDNIACVQLYKKGLYRWHTTCCNMPFANTMNSSKIPFVGIPVQLMQFESVSEKTRILGPITMKAFGKYAIGEMPEDVHAKFPISYIPKILGFMIKGMFGKKNSPSPFFKNGTPVKKVRALS